MFRAMKLLICMLLLFSFIGKSSADDIDVIATQTSFKLSFEELTLHEFADEKMGLDSVEIPPEQVPIAQDMLIKEARKQCKPVIVATQVLESMIEHARPTRAEATDFFIR